MTKEGVFHIIHDICDNDLKKVFKIITTTPSLTYEFFNYHDCPEANAYGYVIRNVLYDKELVLIEYCVPNVTIDPVLNALSPTNTFIYQDFADITYMEVKPGDTIKSDLNASLPNNL